MRWSALLPLSTMSTVACAQVAVGFFVAPTYDHGWMASVMQVGVRAELRPSDSSSVVYRLSVNHAAMPDATWGEVTYDPKDREITSFTRTHELHDQWSAAVDLKWPLTESICRDGYFRGAYAITGAGVSRTRVHGDRTMADLVANTEERVPIAWTTNQWMLRAGAGLQRSFSWGGLYAEAMITLGDAPTSDHQVLFPSTLGITAGYRYVFRKRD